MNDYAEHLKAEYRAQFDIKGTEIARLNGEIARKNDEINRLIARAENLLIQQVKDKKLITDLAAAVEDLEPDGFQYGDLVKLARDRGYLLP